MRTWIATDVLKDWSRGLVVIKAKNKKTAIEIIKKSDLTESGKEEAILALRELKDNEIVYVYGGVIE